MHRNALLAFFDALYASGIPSSDHFLTEQQQYRGIGDVKIGFLMHIIIIQSQTHQKNSQKADRKEGGVNPYGQPDRKKTVFFYDSPKGTPLPLKENKSCIL